jgi:RNA polymerase sigma factor (sigma-70 family)
MTSSDVNSLAAEAKAGNKEAEKTLFECLGARFRLILHHDVRNKEDVEDLVQEALAAVARDYLTTEYRESFAAWVSQVLRNRMLMYYRTRQQDRTRHAPIEVGQLNVAGNQVSPELTATLSECMKKICVVNKRYARILALSFQGFGIDEICQRLGVTTTNAYSILSRARTALAGCLDARGDG